MAAPNLKEPTAIVGKTAAYLCTTTLSPALSNGVNSGKVFRVAGIRASNIAASDAFEVEISHYRGTTHAYIVKGAGIGNKESLIVLQRDEYLYLEEGDEIYAKANASASVQLLITYEEWS